MTVYGVTVSAGVVEFDFVGVVNAGVGEFDAGVAVGLAGSLPGTVLSVTVCWL